MQLRNSSPFMSTLVGIGTTAYVGDPTDARACHSQVLCVDYVIDAEDDVVGDYVTTSSVPARGAHVVIVRPYPEPMLSGYLSVEAGDGLEAGCIEFDTQFPGGHRVRVDAEAVLDYGIDSGIVLQGFAQFDPVSEQPFNKVFWIVNLDPPPNGYTHEVELPDQEYVPMATMLGIASETVHRLHGLPGSPLQDIHRLNIAINHGAQNAFAGPEHIVFGSLDALGKKFIVGHEIGHWLQFQIAQETWAFNYSYGPNFIDGPSLDPFTGDGPLGNPWKEACWFAVENEMVADTRTNPNRHGIRSAEFSSGAMPEGFAHFVAAAAFNDLEEEGRFGYYKDVDEALLTDYEEFENGPDARQVELAGGDENAVGGRSQWTRLECGGEAPNDWDFPLQTETLDDEVSTEIDWLRLFWQYVTASYSGTDPATAPGFWDAVELVTETQINMPWTETIVWPRMDQAINTHLGGNEWVDRWRELSENGANGNAVYNDGT